MTGRDVPELRLAHKGQTVSPQATHIASTAMCNAKTAMRDPETIETELMEISAIADDLVKFERIVAWCVSHPEEVPFALHQLLKLREKDPPQNAHPELGPDQSR